MYFHGGGWVIGSLDTHDLTCRYLARNAQVRVLSVGYRLAPEHHFPAAADDAFAAFRFAVANAETLGADPSAIAVGGDSAGAQPGRRRLPRHRAGQRAAAGVPAAVLPGAPT